MQVTIKCIDFMAGDPVEGCDVTCEVTLKPRFIDHVIKAQGEDSGRRVPTLLGNDDTASVRGDGGFKLGDGTTLPVQRATTGSSGAVTFSFDPLAVVDQLIGQHGNTPEFHDIAVLIALTGQFAGLERTSPHILSTTSNQLLAGNVHLERIMAVDLAKAIVGHTTGQTARLWFQLHPDPLPGGRYECEIDEVPASGDPLQIHPVAFDGSNANTRILDLDGLRPGRTYRYRLLLRPEGSRKPRAGMQLNAGRFRTAAESAQALTTYFGSCHKPVESDDYDPARDMRLWRRLANRDDGDMLLLLGDQIYGDSIPDPGASEPWLDAYIRRYNAFWAYRPVREVFGHIPTYMIPDDHEVTDSWGWDDEISSDRIAGGLEAFRIFQLAHGPGGRDGTIHYHFRRGPVATFMTDGRTARRDDDDAPVLGQAQWSAMERWAASREVRDADVVVIGCAVPPALLPVEQLEDIPSGTVKAVGTILGALGAGPLGAYLGGKGAEVFYETVKEDIGTTFNATDAWTWSSNQVDLKRLLDLAFGIANDTVAGRNGDHPRLVVLLGGDAHIGAIHRIASDHAGGAVDHRRNAQVLQLTSSAIGRNPLDKDSMILLLERFSDDFTLDSDHGGHYRAERLGLLLHERSFGRLQIEQIGPGRTYRLNATIEGETSSLNQLVDVDLDAEKVVWTDVVGQIVAARGVPNLLRVHEIGDSIGGASDRLEDVEVVFQLDGRPGNWFGFPLRPGADEPMARGMLDTVRVAFNTGTPVRVAYRRTGPGNGQAIRVTAQP